MTHRAARSSIAAALIAAIGASTCCVAPLLLAATGVGGARALAALGVLRPFALAATAALLALGFFFTYRKPPAIAGDACGCALPRKNRAARITLWIGTAIAVAFAISPSVLSYVEESGPPSGARAADDTETALIHVGGIDCAACSPAIRKALGKVGGLHDISLDVHAQTIAVTYAPAPGRLQAYVSAIDELGYEASLPGPHSSIPSPEGEKP